MSVVEFTLSGQRIFSVKTGYNFRVRNNDGMFYSIKPTGRNYGVKAEYGFEKFDPDSATLETSCVLPGGGYHLEPISYGWFKLVPGGDDIKISNQSPS